MRPNDLTFENLIAMVDAMPKSVKEMFIERVRKAEQRICKGDRYTTDNQKILDLSVIIALFCWTAHRERKKT